MRASVLAALRGFQTKFEGALTFMYTDVYGLVTTGIGNLIDNGPRRMAAGDSVGGASSAMAQGLGWTKADGSQASSSEVDAEFWNIKNAWPGVQSFGDKSIATLHLPDSSLDVLLTQTAHNFENTLRGYFPDYDNLPADGQLGLLSMAWAMGPAFAGGWPKFTAAVNARDFQTAGAESHMNDTTNPGLRPRNAANLVLFANAAVVQSIGGDPDVLYWPQSVTPDTVQTGSSSSPLRTLGILGAIAVVGTGLGFLLFRKG